MAEPRETLQKEYSIVHKQLVGVGITALAVLGAGAIFYHFVEDLKWLDAFYFCTITLTTVGYGDITPHTDAGKLFTMLYVLIGIGIIATFANLLIKQSMIRRQLKKSKK
jgi:hypothetical protein